MKKTIKKLLPKKIKNFIIGYMNNQLISNYFKKKHQKHALLSYILTPFKKDSLSHTSFFEAQSWAKILDELGYNVDIIDYKNTKKIDLSKYDLICGFGDVFQNYFEGNSIKNAVTINYATGLPICFQNHVTLNRIKDVYEKRKIWLSKSARYVEKNWAHSTTLVDGIITLGNNESLIQFKKYYTGSIFAIPAPFYLTKEPYKIINEKERNSNLNFLWFGSSGLIHKGLDLLLEYFVSHKDLILHVCGPITNEIDFMHVYFKELYNTKNIVTHGFVDINSEEFERILMACDFAILPSVSEGGSPSILTAVGNGGLIPIITKECTISTGYEILINELTSVGIEKAINEAMSLPKDEIIELQKKNVKYVHNNHSKECYYNGLKKSINKIIGDKNG